MLHGLHDRLTPFRRADGGRDWEQRGLVGPVRIMHRRQAVGLGRRFRRQYQRSGISSTMNRHVDLPALEALAKDSRIWRFAHDILGESLVLWRTNVFLGNPVLPWHEDRHAGLFAGDAFSVSLMLAIEDSPPDNCVVFARGSHRLSMEQKERRFGIEARRQAFGNLRYSGHVEAKSCEFVPLKAGELIVFHPELMHASSGHVNGLAEVSAERMSIVFRVTTPAAKLQDEAFAHGPGDGNSVLCTIRSTP